MRNTLWLHILEDLGQEEDCILPIWLRIVYLLIFPLQGFRLLLGSATGFDFLRMTYEIHGVQFSARTFLRLSRARGEIYRFTNINGILAVERVESP